MITFTIDGKEIEVPKGWTILQAAMEQGIDIPHYCYHQGLSIAGNCRICLVEVEKFPKPAIACNTLVADGMVVHTDNDKVKQWREAVMEFLLINHPLDCPICDQAGECKLQEFSYRYGAPTTRFVEEKEHGPKARELGPHIVFDWERCIKCTRCIRFCQEVPKTGELDMFLRGVREEIGVFPGKPLDNPYSGNVADICPVGALTLKEFRFRSRVWFLQDVPSTCPGCARGCSIDVGEFRNEIFRITPRENHAVNRWWICDTGRLWGERLRESVARRLDGPKGGGSGETFDRAIAAAAEALLPAAREGRARLLASPRATLEETWLLAKIAESLPGDVPVHLPAHEAGEDDEVLIRADRTPNARGAALVLESLAGGAKPVAELADALAGGKVDALLALGPGLVGPVDDEKAPLDKALLEKLSALVVIDAHASPLSDAAKIVLPSTSYAESSGTYVNFAGRVQWVERCLNPPVECRPTTMLLGDLLRTISPDTAVPAPVELHARIAEEVEALGEVDWEELPGGEGQNLRGVNAEEQACPATGALVQMMAAVEAERSAPAGE